MSLYFQKNRDELIKTFKDFENNKDLIEKINDDIDIICEYNKIKEYPNDFIRYSKSPIAININNNIFIVCRHEDDNIGLFDKNNGRLDQSYDYSQPLAINIIRLFEKYPHIYNQVFVDGNYINKELTIEDYDKKENLKNNKIKNLNISSSKNKEDNNDSNSSKDEVQDKVEDSIKDNKDLLTPLAKAANITGEKLRDIITKVCLDKKGKSRKLDESVILGLSIMLCGVILTIKKSGKSDNAAILAVTDKITSIVKNKKSIKNTI